MPLATLRSLFTRFSSFFRRSHLERELHAELDSHLQLNIDDNLRRGLSPEEARRQALLQLGGLEQTKERIRDQRALPFLETSLQDLRFAARILRKSPAFTLVVVLTLALGIAANATIFAMVSRFVLHIAPVGHPGALLSLYTTEHNTCCNSFSWPLYSDLHDNAHSFSGVAAFYELLPASISGSGDPQRFWGQATTTNFFDVTQLSMTLGRGFRSDELHSPVVILGHRVWRSRFHADPSIVGKFITLSGHPYTVVGVAPPGFRGIDLVLDAQFWVPIGDLDQLLPNTARFDDRDDHWVAVTARLKPGVSQAESSVELTLLARRFALANPASQKDLGFHLEQAGSLPPRDKTIILSFLATLMIVALLVLLIACANVANLFLAHSSARRREMAVRVALGATRAQLLRQVLTESTLLALLGGLLGIVISVWATGGLSAFRFPAPVSLDLNVGIDSKVVVFTFLLSLATGLVFGLLPAWTSSWLRPSAALKGEDLLGRPGRFFTLRNLLVVAQISLSLILLCATGLFLRSLQSAANIDIGFRSRGLVAMSVDPRLHGYTAEQTTRFLAELQRRVAAIPGVTSAAVTDALPLSGGHRADGYQPVGRKPLDPAPSVELYMATPGYLDTMGIHLIAGRDFRNESAVSPRVVIVNQILAAKMFPGEDPVGQSITSGGVDYEIVGVTNNIKARFLGEQLRPVLFRPLSQTVASDPSFDGYTVLASVAGAAVSQHSVSALSSFLGRQSSVSDAAIASVAHSMHAVLREMDPTLAVFKEQTMEHHLREALFLPRLAGTLFAVFGATGLLLASIGLYGVMNYLVTLRTREIGIRMAFGAPSSRILRLILRQGALLILVALVMGLPLALLIAKLFHSILYGVQPHDALTFTLVPLFLAAVGFLACFIPARRASRVDPMISLRYE